MGHNAAAAAGSLDHGSSHIIRSLHSAAIVGEACHIGHQCLHINNFALSPTTFGNRRIRKDFDGGIFLYCLKFKLEIPEAIGNGIQIRHCTNGGKPASGGRCSTCCYCLLGFLTRFPEMDVKIHEPGNDKKRGTIINDCSTFVVNTLRNAGNNTVADPYVFPEKESVRGKDHGRFEYRSSGCHSSEISELRS